MDIKIIITGEQREERPDLDGHHRIIEQRDVYIFLLSIYSI